MNLNNLPDIEFASKDVESILNNMISGYEEAYFKQTGEVKKLYPGDPIRIFLYSQALREFQLRQIIDFSAKQNLLKYASKNYLENLGALHKITRFQPTKAVVTEKFILSAPQATEQIIPAGTRVSAGGDIYFETTNEITIESGITEITAVLQCTEEGEKGNGFTPGQLNVLVDSIPWIATVVNIDTSQGGSDIEDDESFRERIWIAPEGFSVAGPEGAYIYHAKQYSPLILDIIVTSPNPGTVDIRVLLKDGEIPEQSFLEGLQEYLSAKNRRPLTDYVIVGAPEVINYDINLTYYILRENSTGAAAIQSKVIQAVENYKLWQKSKIGRDINPSKLTADLITAGAYRVDISSPIFVHLEPTQVAVAQNVNLVYGGLVDD